MGGPAFTDPVLMMHSLLLLVLLLWRRSNFGVIGNPCSVVTHDESGDTLCLVQKPKNPSRRRRSEQNTATVPHQCHSGAPFVLLTCDSCVNMFCV